MSNSVECLRLAAVMVAAAFLYLPPGEFVFGGLDPGVYFNSGVAFAGRGEFTFRDPLLAAAGPAAEAAFVDAAPGPDPYVQPGFYWNTDAGRMVTQFPFLLTVWTAAGVWVGGPAGGLYAPVTAALLAVAAFYAFARRLVGRDAALAATVLLAGNGLQLWHARLSLAEQMVQLMLFGGLWAGMWFRSEGGRLPASLAGTALGLLPLVKTEATVLALFGCIAVSWRPAPSGARWFWAPYAGLMLAAGIHYATTARPVAMGQIVGAWVFILLSGLMAGVAVAARLWPGWRLYVPRGHLDRWRQRALGWPLGTGLVLAIAGLVFLVGPFLRALFTGTYLTLLDAVLLAAGAVIAVRAARGSLAVPFPVLAALVGGAVLYLAIFYRYFLAQDVIPLYLWGTRRLLAVVLPLTAVLEGWALLAAVRALVSPGRRGLVVAISLAALMAARVPELALLREHREYEGALAAVAEIAGGTESGAVFLLDGDDTGIRFGAPLRFVHDRPAYLLWDGASPRGVDALINAAAEAALPVYFLGRERPAGLRVADVRPVGEWLFRFPELERTSAGRPSRWNTYTAELRLYRVSSP